MEEPQLTESEREVVQAISYLEDKILVSAETDELTRGSVEKAAWLLLDILERLVELGVAPSHLKALALLLDHID